ncbi:MAG: DNA polymerase III subunit delta [Chloroflexi bacterium]|nr:DNA polymerase III subunit delta [Chloroflexota bacterium]
MIRVFHGDDGFSISEVVRRTRLSVGAEELRDSNTTLLEGNSFKPFDIIAAASTLPFIADRRLVLVYGLLGSMDGRDNKRGAEWDKLPAMLADLPGTSDVVFVESKPLRANARGVKAAGPGAEVREFSAPRGPALEAWARDRFTRYEATATRDAIARLVWLAGGDLRLLDSEIGKLALYAGEREVTQADVDEMVGEAREASIFAAVDAVLERRPGVAMRLMYSLLEGGTSVSSIIAMLARQVRLVLLAGTLRAGNVPQQEIGTRIGVTNRYALEKTLGQTSRFGKDYLAQVHRRLLDADLDIKTGKLDERLALEILVGRLSGS